MDTIIITNDPKVAKLADNSSISRVMVDLEVLGKDTRQGHLNTVISRHSLSDIKPIKSVLNNSKLLVRINPINPSSKEEIETVIQDGADILMLPMFKTTNEVKEFIQLVDKRATTCLLLETPQALVRVDEILEIEGIDEIHIGLNDLHLGMNLTFMFELLSGGIIEYLSNKITQKGIKFGFGGVGRLKEGLLLDPKLILSEHVRLKSDMVILSRDFHGHSSNYEELIQNVDLKEEVGKLHEFILELKSKSPTKLIANKENLKKIVKQIVNSKLT